MGTAHSQHVGYESGHRFSALDLTLVIGLHLGVGAALLAFDVVPLPQPLATLMVRMIPPQAAVAPPPDVTPPRPKPVSKPTPQPRPVPVSERPVLAAETTAPAAAEVPAVKPAPPAPPVVSPPPPLPVSEPRFDAAYLDNPAPAYPPMSRRLGEEGKVVLRVFVEADGRPSQIQVNAGSGSPRLDQAALEAVRRWKFVPAKRGTDVVGAWVLVPIAFNLKG